MKKPVLYALHIIIITLFFLLMFQAAAGITAQFKDSYSLNLIDSTVLYGSLLGLTYFAYWLFIPKFLVRKQYWKFFAGLLGIIVGYVIYANLTRLALAPLLGDNFHMAGARSIASSVTFAITIGMAGTFFRLFVEWLRDSYKKIELEKQNVKSELAFLKNQLNPHFLFNILNNIDALIIEKSQNASLALNKLSEIMRYMVYDTEKDFVPLADEVNYIKNYIALQTLRMPSEGIVHFDVQGAVTDQQIAPMLFIPFIENAFKHSSLKDKMENRIEIRIIARQNALSFYCSNNMAEIKKDKSSGVGLGIVQKRLDLLYKDKYKLNAGKQGSQYVVNLDIKT